MDKPIAIIIPFNNRSNIAVRGTQPRTEKDWKEFTGICTIITTSEEQ